MRTGIHPVTEAQRSYSADSNLPDVFRRARELGPALLVPLAWAVVAAAHVGVVSDRHLLIAHVVMSVLLAGFALTGRADMRSGALLGWWRLIAVGTLVTLVGTAGFLVETVETPLRAVALFGWMLLPAVGFLDTAGRVSDGRVYAVGAVVCGLGAVSYLGGAALSVDAGILAGLVLVGAGQTAAIIHATRLD